MSLAGDLNKITIEVHTKRAQELAEESARIKKEREKYIQSWVSESIARTQKECRKLAENGETLYDMGSFQCDQDGQIFDVRQQEVFDQLACWARAENFNVEISVRNHKNDDDSWCEKNLRIMWHEIGTISTTGQ